MFPGDSSLYAHHVYRSLFGAKECSGVTFSDYVTALSILLRGGILDKLEWIFKVYDPISIHHDHRYRITCQSLDP